MKDKVANFVEYLAGRGAMPQNYILAYGSDGSGKTENCVIPFLSHNVRCHNNFCAITTDGTVPAKLAPLLKTAGYHVIARKMDNINAIQDILLWATALQAGPNVALFLVFPRCDARSAQECNESLSMTLTCLLKYQSSKVPCSLCIDDFDSLGKADRFVPLLEAKTGNVGQVMITCSSAMKMQDIYGEDEFWRITKLFPLQVILDNHILTHKTVLTLSSYLTYIRDNGEYRVIKKKSDIIRRLTEMQNTECYVLDTNDSEGTSAGKRGEPLGRFFQKGDYLPLLSTLVRKGARNQVESKTAASCQL